MESVITLSRMKPRTRLSHLQEAHRIKTSLLNAQQRKDAEAGAIYPRIWCVRNPGFATIDDESSVYVLRRSLHVCGIRTMIRFCETLVVTLVRAR